MQSSIWELQTEQSHPKYDRLDVSSTTEILQMMNEADHSVPVAVGKVLPDIASAVELIVSRLQQGGRLFYIGAGTSGRLGVLDAAECPPTFSTPHELVQGIIAGGRSAMFEAVEEAEDNSGSAQTDLENLLLSAKDVVVGITASGRTPYVIGGLLYAKSIGAGTVSVACNPLSKVSSCAEVAIEVDTGPEVLSGSTRLKAGTAAKLVLNMLSTASMVRLGKAYHNLMVDMKVTNEKLLERARRMVMVAADVDYATAQSTLEAANGHVKKAILMARRDVDKTSADQLLAGANGFLRYALGEVDR